MPRKMTVSELAEATNLAPRTVRYWAKKLGFPKNARGDYEFTPKQAESIKNRKTTPGPERKSR